MTLDEDLWFTFLAESIAQDEDYLFTATANFKGENTEIVLLVSCKQSLPSINLAYSNTNPEAPNIEGQNEFSDAVKITYQLGTNGVRGYCVRGQRKDGFLRIIGLSYDQFDTEGYETTGDENYIPPGSYS